MDYKIVWSDESLKNLDDILSYLEEKWTAKEIIRFKSKLSRQIELISANPLLFPVSQFQPRLRKAVLSKQTTIFYEAKGKNIFIAYIFSNKMNPKRIK
jgi:plasmid stabilization system protein ParE